MSFGRDLGNEPWPRREWAWMCSDGKLFPGDQEKEALRHQITATEAAYKLQMDEARKARERDSDEPASSYGSSGGGGHD